MTSPPPSGILEDNPYVGHPELTPLEAEVLWEYAKMAGLVKQLAATTRTVANEPANDLLAKLRIVENQMGLVLTLFKASVWSTIVTAEAQDEQSITGADETIQGPSRPSGIPRRSTATTSYGDNTAQDESYDYSEDITPQPRYHR